MLVALVGSVIAGLGLSTGSAWAQEEGVQATLTYQDEPVPGVTISVFTEDGRLIGSAQTDADGYWTVPVPGSATYRVELDPGTLPEGVVPATGTVREPFVRPGSLGNVIFRLTAGTGQPGEPTAPGPGTPGQPPTTEPPGGEPGAPAIPADPEEDVEVVSGSSFLDRLISHFYSGIHLGLIVALAALGLSLVYGTMGLINFAHGELVSFGALVALLFNVIGISLFGFDLKLHLLVATPVAVAAGALFGYLQDRFFWGWLRRRSTGVIAMMIISIGVALLLRNLYLYVIGPGRQLYDQYAVQRPDQFGPLSVPVKTLITDGIALVVLVVVALALVLTRLGKAVRAVADNPALAAASGINVDRIIRLVWAVGGGLAALSGVFLALHESANYLMGFQMLLLIFAAVVVGGVGTAFGAVVGGLIVGVLIQLSAMWLANYGATELKYVFALALLIVVLLTRPQGILGRRERVG
jgi:branched-chain amino acid transport system permease protein